MAKHQLIYTIALFFILITCQMLSSKARHLKSHRVSKSSRSKRTTTKFDIHDCPCTTKLACPPDAHGTSPCHRRSPGHGPCPPCPSPPAFENPTKWDTLAPSADYIHHTTPGRSPVAGHAEEDTINPTLRASAVAYQTDFKPTAPGSSPGAGHSETSKDETQHCTDEGCINDFPLTAPGDSPGAGHAFTNISDSNTSEHGGVEQPQATGKTIDDYRPTAPGHSPGAGHALSTQTIKPNT